VAALQKTYRGDLSTAIAGVLWSRIKEADTKKELEKSNASDDIKQAAVELKKEDPSDNSIPVQDKDLRNTVVRIFGNLEGRLFSLQGKANNISGKITTLAGGVADTQDLIINQNQMLEDKFDIILQNIGSVSAIERSNAAESELDKVEAELEKGFDLSGTFAYEKTNTGSFGIFGKILSGILGNRFTAQLIGQISKSLIPRTVRARAKLLRNASIGAIKRSAKKFAGSRITKRILTPFSLFGGKKAAGILGRKFGTQIAQFDVLPIFLRRKLLKEGFGLGIQREFAKRGLGKVTASSLAEAIITQVKTRGARGVTLGGRSLASPITKKVSKKLGVDVAKQSSKKVVKKAAPKVLNETLGNLDGVFLKALDNPKVQAEIINKIGREGAEKLGIKLASGAVKGGFPVFGSGYALVEGMIRLAMGDAEGMMLSFGSGVPTAGWGFAILDILRDIDKAAYNRYIRPKVAAIPPQIPNDSDIAGYFQMAFGLNPNQLERGNVNIKSPMLGGNNVDAISQILSVTKAFGDATGYGGEADQIIGESGFGSFNIPRGNYKFDVGKFSPVKNIEGIQRSEEEKELRMARKEKDEDNDEEPKVGDVKQDNQKNFFGAQQGREGYDNQGFDFWDWLPDNWFNKPSSDKVELKGEGGIGGKDVIAQTPIMGGDASTIEFYGQQGRDRSGEPGVDFSFKDYKNNYNLFPGYVLETGLLYGKGYGNVVVVRSTDPTNGKQFDALYSHFPDGGIAVKAGQQVGAGDLLGSVGFVSVDTPGVPQLQPNNAGNMSGWHTSVDFFEPDSPARYSNADSLINLVVGARNSTPHGLLESLKPVTSDNETSLNSISSNTNLASTMTNMVESGSNERLMTQRKVAKKNPIVIVNNQVISNITNATSMGMKPDQQDLFEAFNLARHTV